MKNLIDALTEQLQLWLGEATPITPGDVTKMLLKAQADALKGVKRVKISLEGEPEDVALLAGAIKEILPAGEKKAGTAMLDGGHIRRELEIEGEVEEEITPRPGNLNPQRLTPKQPEPAQPQRSSSEKLLYDALQTLARGLLQFPTDDEGRRQFGSAYPPTFKEGIGKLSAFLLTKGVVISDSLEYWRLLSKPLKEWPHMPGYLQSPHPLIDNYGRTTVLTHHLGQTNE